MVQMEIVQIITSGIIKKLLFIFHYLEEYSYTFFCNLPKIKVEYAFIYAAYFKHFTFLAATIFPRI